ncbi:MAG: cytochrome c oxidase assembly protein [Alphaproteobacteria bacterium]|nr:cytochrome c oxidase assembly protein [Alphaproteobacteria bacterium]
MPPKDHKRITFLLVALVFFMLGLAFLSVPLYQIFCKETGFGGTPKIATLAQLPGYSLKRQVKVHFTASTHRDLEWDFKTMQSETMINLGQVRIMFYKAKNISDRPIIGMATYNVTPEKAGSYFNKVACFCFEQQLLQPGEEMDMPVQFFIDPDYDKDSLMEDVNEITLSYTFFEYKP